MNKTIKDVCLFIYLKSTIANIFQTMVLMYNAIKFNLLVECTYVKLVIN